MLQQMSFKNNHLSVAQALIKYASDAKYSLIFQGLLCIAWALKEALFPYFIKNIVNYLALPYSQININNIYMQIALLTGIWLLMECAMRLQNFVAVRTFPRLRGIIRESIFEQVQHSTFQENFNQLSGTLSSKIIGLPKAVESVLEILVLHIPSIGCAFIIGLFLLFNVNHLFAIFALGWAILHIATHIIFSKYCIRIASEHADSEYQLNGRITDFFINRFTTKLYSTKSHEIEKFKILQENEIRKARETRKAIEVPKYIQSLLAIFFIAAIMLTLVQKWKIGLISLGDFALVPMLSFSIVGMVTWFSFQITTLLKELGYIQSAIKLFDRTIQEKNNSICNKSTDIKIDIQGLDFGHQNNSKLFSNLNLTINPREKIWIFGDSGEGKSTLAKIIMGILKPDQGQILLGEKSILDFSTTEISNYITLVPQIPELYNDTVLENIVYGLSDYDIVQVNQILNSVQATKFIENLPNHLQTIIGERGYNLSIGQAQRISLARAILRNRPVLILDEATSGLDLKTEIKIFENLYEYLQNKTLIIISHHPRTLGYVNNIYVLKEKQIIPYSSQEVENIFSSAYSSSIEAT